jgi:peptide/nickel transport system permease protein
MTRLALGTLRFLVVVATTYLGLLAVTFFIGRVIPIDPVLAVLGDRAPEAAMTHMRAAMGLNLPVWQQFALYVRQALSGDFGTSVLTTNPVIDDIARVFPATIELATLGTLIGAALGIPLGVLAAVRRGSLVDQIARVIGLVGYSMPIFWMALLALLVFYAKLHWVAFPGRIGIAYAYSFTPITGFLLVDPVARGDDIFLAARAKGLSEARIIWRHALRNAAVPLVTVIVLSYAGLLEGSVLTETVFSWPGLGRYITDSLENADMNAVLGGTIVIGSVFIGLNLLSDLLSRTLDPRMRAK